jgi:hypothetical protein
MTTKRCAFPSLPAGTNFTEVLRMNAGIRLSFLAALVLCTAVAFAQPAHRFTFNIGGGPTIPVGPVHSRLNTGYNFNAGGGLNLSDAFAITAEFGYNHLGVSDRALSELSVPDGSSRVYSVTINPMLRFGYDRKFGGYIIGGGGWYRRTVEFTRPTTTTVPFFDPWFGFFGTAVIPADVVIGSRTIDTGGANVGAGLTIGVAQGAKFYTEVRYHWMNAGTHDTTLLPVTFGLRW